ncbi:sulfotransferase family protein [Robertkochia solimangrovi]|uniref:sulfotransferase family protein n=1 Tax=Robertkochia solimangrovi TaxID=2213046 RepID=UPI00117CA967|nr:sulfotransferase family protein [Robertkochia solimangrovi]TRZ45004.1 hypothetical protein DMZ48_04375 [Robertkochia solimangrovi]
MKVFGIGLNKTGTTSLGKALEILGYSKHISCNLELTENWSEGNLLPILEVAHKHNNFEDWPWPLIYKELYKEFDDAKFILTIRSSPEEWYNSLCKHAIRTGPTKFRKLIYGHEMPQEYMKQHLDFYNQHNKNVIEFFNSVDPNKLLVISLNEGNNWQKLCEFLDKDIPEVEFPFLNTAISFKKNSSDEAEELKISFLTQILNYGKQLKRKF